jgi:hypothetical protein
MWESLTTFFTAIGETAGAENGSYRSLKLIIYLLQKNENILTIYF